METIHEEADTEKGCPENPKWLKQGRIKRALHARERDLNTAADDTPKDRLHTIPYHTIYSIACKRNIAIHDNYKRIYMYIYVRVSNSSYDRCPQITYGDNNEKQFHIKL